MYIEPSRVRIAGFDLCRSGKTRGNNAVTYMVTPSYKISRDLMVYARVATGYRPGTLNSIYLGVPPSSQPDKTANYDLGLKGSFLDSRLSLDVSAYYIDWKNIQ